MSPRIAQQVGPDQVGQRVVLRRRLPDGSAGDLLGDLIRWDVITAHTPPDPMVTVRTLRGDVTVRVADVLGGKPVPPRPARRGRPHRTIGWTDLEDVASDGWQAVERERWTAEGTAHPSEPGWLLRASDGFTSRANSVLALGDPGLALPSAIDRAHDWYAARGLAPRFAVAWPLGAVRPGPDGSHGDEGDYGNGVDTDLDTGLATRGYRVDTPTLVMTAATREVRVATTPPLEAITEAGSDAGWDIRLDETPDDAWLAVYHYRGQQLPAVATRLLTSAPAQAFVSLRDADGRAVAVGRGASSRGWTGITAMEVAPQWQRRGLGLQVLRALADWAEAQDDRCLYLQVAVGNVAGRALYDSVGFDVHHGYHYRVLDPAARSGQPGVSASVVDQ